MAETETQEIDGALHSLSLTGKILGVQSGTVTKYGNSYVVSKLPKEWLGSMVYVVRVD